MAPEPTLHTAYLCLGGNLGNRTANLEEARLFVHWNMGDVVTASQVYETQPWQMAGAPPFLNQVLCIRTTCTLEQLMAEIAELDTFFDRKRTTGQYLSREMDVDLLYFDQEVMNSPGCVLPHPRIADRKFVLVPLCEIAPDLVHPVLKKTSRELLESCTDTCEVRPC